MFKRFKKACSWLYDTFVPNESDDIVETLFKALFWIGMMVEISLITFLLSLTPPIGLVIMLSTISLEMTTLVPASACIIFKLKLEKAKEIITSVNSETDLSTVVSNLAMRPNLFKENPAKLVELFYDKVQAEIERANNDDNRKLQLQQVKQLFDEYIGQQKVPLSLSTHKKVGDESPVLRTDLVLPSNTEILSPKVTTAVQDLKI
jgi:hypothetical protein